MVAGSKGTVGRLFDIACFEQIMRSVAVDTYGEGQETPTAAAGDLEHLQDRQQGGVARHRGGSRRVRCDGAGRDGVQGAGQQVDGDTQVSLAERLHSHPLHFLIPCFEFLFCRVEGRRDAIVGRRRRVRTGVD